MKTTVKLITLLFILNFFNSWSQGINYKALIKDGSGNVVANQSITVQFTILKGVAETNVYQETHTPVTDDNGIVMVNIGVGTPDSGVFTDVHWGSDDHYLNVQIDKGTGLTDMGTTQFMSVPYALHAKSVELSYFYADRDGDGFGDKFSVANSQLDGFVENNEDCNDLNETTNPDASEICGDEIDNDCDGQIDETCGSNQILMARISADGAVSLPIDEVYVTYVYETTWFTIQAENQGPALLIYVPDTGLNVIPGDKVSFTITEMSTYNGIREATGISGLTISSIGNDINGLIQDLSNVSDVVSNAENYESELITITGTIASNFLATGSNYKSAQFETNGVSGNSNFVLRLPNTLSSNLSVGCEVTINSTPMGRFNELIQISAWFIEELNILYCPNLDTDQDGILDDGDNSGTIGDNPCISGNTTSCDDNCPDNPNPLQEDTDSDGIGDVCDTDLSVLITEILPNPLELSLDVPDFFTIILNEPAGLGGVEVSISSSPSTLTIPENVQIPEGDDSAMVELSATIEGEYIVTFDLNGQQTDVFVYAVDPLNIDSDGDGYSIAEGDCNDFEALIYPGAIDVPDSNFIDSNCDGIDGDEANAIFVSTLGNDSNVGSKLEPKLTIQEAINVAVIDNKNQVLIANGNYNETINLASEVSLFGGFNQTTWTRDFNLNQTNIYGVNVTISGISISNVLIDGMYIHSANVDTNGESSYGIILVSCDNVDVKNCTVTSGNGGNGIDGANGVYGQVGSSGLNGQDGCEDSGGACSTCDRPEYGKGGTSNCGNDGGNGGLPGHGTGDGSHGSSGIAYNGGIGGIGGQGSDNENECGLDGGQGINGQYGNNGIAGLSIGDLNNSGQYITSDGEDGMDGTPGSGGGGGGGGHGGSSWCDSYGGAGGGGGAGGCQGGRGLKGIGGGASITIVLVNCGNEIDIMNCNIISGNGGDGGDGGTGGSGGLGGLGGVGGVGEDDSTCGGKGGAGGEGGAGGHGGGGAGGPSIGILSKNTNYNSNNTFSIGLGGNGGLSNGNNGQDGLAVSEANL